MQDKEHQQNLYLYFQEYQSSYSRKINFLSFVSASSRQSYSLSILNSNISRAEDVITFNRKKETKRKACQA